MDKKTLYSALITLNYFKGYSVIRTKNINETCELVVNFADKLEKESKKESYYEADKMKTTISVNKMNENTETTEIPETTGPRYCEVMKKQKKDNITTENIGEIMLSCIPGVSSKSAITIMKEYKTVKNLISNLQENEGCLDGMKMIAENGMSRKISKSCIENIKKFVLV